MAYSRLPHSKRLHELFQFALGCAEYFFYIRVGVEVVAVVREVADQTNALIAFLSPLSARRTKFFAAGLTL